MHACLQLFNGQEAIVVCIQLVEHGTDLDQIVGLGLEVGNDRADARLEGSCLSEGGQVG